MAAPAITKNPTQVRTGPGKIFLAALGSTVPTWAVTGSVFSNSWDAAWTSVGYTDDGLTITLGRSVEDVEVAEEFYPIARKTTQMNGSATFSMAGVNLANLKFALNGGSWATTGTGATTMNKYSPPSPGSEVRCMLAWIGDAADEVFIAYQVYQSGELSWARQKGAAKASLSGLTFDFEVPSTGVSADVWNYYTAGTWSA